MFCSLRILFIGIGLFVLKSTFAYSNQAQSIHIVDNLIGIDYSRIKQERLNIINLHEEALKQSHPDSIKIFKELSVLYSQNDDVTNACNYLKKYMRSSQDLAILNDHVFTNIKDKPEYIIIKEKYSAKVNGWSILYIFSGLLGFLIFVVLNFRKNLDKTGVLFISLFVLFHSLFILHLSIYVTNYQYYIPNSFYASTTFSFLYGPLLYFYFKRIINNYEVSWKDIWHLLPSVALLLYIMPYYLMSSQEKFLLMFDQVNFLLPGAKIIVICKIISLVVYAVLIIKMFNRLNRINVIDENKYMILWKRNIVAIYIFYIIAYTIYGAILIQIISFHPLIFHLQILAMVCLVFYVAYIALVQPNVFKGEILLVDPNAIFKYKKSALTPSYSLELKDKLIHLITRDKLYKINDISLELLSDKLGTTRHNTSQVINEHFDMNFFEFINRFRINEAISILENDINGNLKIIDIAYEVGYNNKVTFNKAFKKETSFTPTNYLLTLSQRVISKP